MMIKVSSLIFEDIFPGLPVADFAVAHPQVRADDADWRVRPHGRHPHGDLQGRDHQDRGHHRHRRLSRRRGR